MKKIVPVIAVMCSIVLVSSCTTARKQAMMPDSSEFAAKLPYSVCVGYSGEDVRDQRSRNPNAAKYFGRENATSVEAQTFMDTVVSAVQASALFRDVVSKGAADYRLDVNIISEILPAPGMQMQATLVTAWKLTRSSDGKVVSDELIEKTYKATPGSFVGIRTAVEGSVRESIKEGIQRLSRPGLVK